MKIVRFFSATAFAMIVAFNVSAGGPFVMQLGGPLPDVYAVMGIVVQEKPGAELLIDSAMFGDLTGPGTRLRTPGATQGFTPDPPPPPPRVVAKRLTPGTTQGFNPQPEPPRIRAGLQTPGAIQGFNPQPEPPRIRTGVTTPGIAPGPQSAPATKTP